jgi:hypothetical protein
MAGMNRYHWNFLFPPTPQQQKVFLERMEEAFKTLRERIETDLEKQLDKLYAEFKQATTPAEWNRLRRELIDDFGDILRSRRFLGREIKGPEAVPGTYRVILKVNGMSYSGFLSVREDPML